MANVCLAESAGARGHVVLQVTSDQEAVVKVRALALADGVGAARVVHEVESLALRDEAIY
jgi:hypothetical protein